MATHDEGFRPTAAEARAAIDAADAEELATRNRPVPRWYFPALAVLIAAIFLLHTVEDPRGPLRIVLAVVTLTAAVAVGALVGRVSFHQPGYRGVRVAWRSMIPAVLVAGVLAVLPVLLDERVGSWIWAVCGLVLAGLIAISGELYWRRYSRG